MARTLSTQLAQGLSAMVLATALLAAASAATAQSVATCDSRGLQRIVGSANCANVTDNDAATMHAQASGVRAALVIGESNYRVAGDAATSSADAAQVAAALGKAGWQVTTANDPDAADLDAIVRRFAASLHAGDAALVYFSGLAAKGTPVGAGSGTENYLLAADASPHSKADVAQGGMALSTILSRLTASGASAQIIIVDAARPNRVEPGWAAPAGLTEPTSSALANAFIIFPASPGRLAREGLFVPAFVDAVKTPGLSAAQLALDVSSSVDRETGGQQTPWFSGSGGSSRLVVGPIVNAAQTHGAAARPAEDSARRAQAIACGTAQCLAQAARRVGDPLVAVDLLLRSEVTGAETIDAPFVATTALPAKAAPPQSYIEAFIEANKASPDGMRRIGMAYLNGTGGFPVSANQAYPWLMRGASAGDAEAAFQLAAFFDLGKPPVGHVDKDYAVRLYQQAAAKGIAGAAWHLGRAYARGEGGLPIDPVASARWIAQAKADGWQPGKE